MRFKHILVTALAGLSLVRCASHFYTLPQRIPSPPTKRPKVLLYVTTHLSESHATFLQKCWPRLLKHSPLFRAADFRMFVTKANTASINTDFIYSIFSRVNNFKIYFHETNPGYQQGAMLAMEVAFDMHWFDGYDWVVRLNPDVLMRDDRVISREMRNASTVGVFVDCHEVRCDSPECTRKKVVNTDFFCIPSRFGRRRCLQIRKLLAGGGAGDACIPFGDPKSQCQLADWCGPIKWCVPGAG